MAVVWFLFSVNNALSTEEVILHQRRSKCVPQTSVNPRRLAWGAVGFKLYVGRKRYSSEYFLYFHKYVCLE